MAPPQEMRRQTAWRQYEEKEKQDMAKSVKLSDIAQRVGVSTVTVSKALADQKGVSEEMRARIKELAQEMGYKPPSAARKVQTTKSYNIGVLAQEGYLEKFSSFYWQMYQAVTQKATSVGSIAILEVVREQDAESGRMPLILQEKKVDGVIIIGAMKQPYLKKLEQSAGVPIIYLDYYDKTRQRDTVISNSIYGTNMLTNYLFDMGHRDIAFVGTLLATTSITDRYLGYTKALMEHGVSVRQDWIIEDRDIKEAKIDPEHKIVLPQEMPTAFVCNCDLAAGYLIRKLEAAGYRVPEDISVVGFDNYIYPGVSDVEITTYEVDMPEMAHRAVSNMIKKIENSSYEPGMFIVDGRLVYKDSVARR